MSFIFWVIVSAFTLASALLHIELPKGFPPWIGTNKWDSPVYTWQFQYPLPIPADASPSYIETINGTMVEFYSSSIEPFQMQIYPNLDPTDLIGFNATSPGPTYRIERNTETIIRHTNNGYNPASTHLHGSWTRAPWDGWADDTMQVGEYKDYYYPNYGPARTLWYHDHASHFTSVNAYYGQNGVYILHDSSEDILGLPRGRYDVPICLMDKRYQHNGQLYSPENETLNFFGDIIHVNGQPWPYFEVEPRKYRLRFLNTCLSRGFELWFNDDDTGDWIPFDIIASDGGLFSRSVQTTTMDISMGERYEVVFDFSNYAGKNITLGNNMQVPDILEYDSTNKVMRFVVGTTVQDGSNNELPDILAHESAVLQRTGVDHVFNFQRNLSDWTINGVTYSDVEARVLARPPQGTTENWQLRYVSGPGLHPVHIHLVDFNVVSRSGGRRAVLPYESAGRKDVVLLEPGEVVNVVARYGPWQGLYQFHCHNLIHEDHEMMDVMNITSLKALGYEDAEVYANPMDPAFGPRPFDVAEYQADYITATVIPGLAGSPAYRGYSKLVSDLDAYWATQSGDEITSSGSSAADSMRASATTTSAVAKVTATNGNGNIIGGVLDGAGNAVTAILG